MRAVLQVVFVLAVGSASASASASASGSGSGSGPAGDHDHGVDDIKPDDHQPPQAGSLHSTVYSSLTMEEQWRVVGEKLHVFAESGKIRFLGDSPMQFLGMTQKTYNLYLPAPEDKDKDRTASSKIEKLGEKIAVTKIRKGCWFIFCAFWRKEAWMDIFDVELTQRKENWVIEHFYEGPFTRGHWEIYLKDKKDAKETHFVIPGQRYGAQYRKACLPKDPAKMASHEFNCKTGPDGKDQVALELLPDRKNWFTKGWEIRDYANGSGADKTKLDMPEELATVISFVINRKIHRDEAARNSNSYHFKERHASLKKVPVTQRQQQRQQQQRRQRQQHLEQQQARI
eukprot:g4835.t1